MHSHFSLAIHYILVSFITVLQLAITDIESILGTTVENAEDTEAD